MEILKNPKIQKETNQDGRNHRASVSFKLERPGKRFSLFVARLNTHMSR